MKPDNFNMEDSHQQIEFGNNTAVFISVRLECFDLFYFNFYFTSIENDIINENDKMKDIAASMIFNIPLHQNLNYTSVCCNTAIK